MGRAGTFKLEGVDDGLCCTVDVVAIRPWSAKLYGFLDRCTRILTNSPIAEEAKVMLQGVGARFDFHMCKTLCDLRYVECPAVCGVG